MFSNQNMRLSEIFVNSNLILHIWHWQVFSESNKSNSYFYLPVKLDFVRKCCQNFEYRFEHNFLTLQPGKSCHVKEISFITHDLTHLKKHNKKTHSIRCHFNSGILQFCAIAQDFAFKNESVNLSKIITLLVWNFLRSACNYKW